MSPTSPRAPVFYAVVQHEFIAERADELDAKSGDHISVVAQSNYEWFVAKPISRLGRPGLIPVSFVAIHDPTTGRAMSEEEVRNIMQRGDIPNVDEWKKSILDYKAASITLGVIDDDATRGPVPNSPFMPPQSPNPEAPRMQQQEPQRSKTPLPTLPPGLLVSAHVVSWHFEMDEYWFRINAIYQPDGPSGSNSLPPAKHLILFRVYNDFYDFQVNLLNVFPLEAGRGSGRESGHDQDGQVEEGKRILPFMPGPAAKVDDKITNIRKEELDTYLSQFCSLWEYEAEHILRHKLIRDFFSPKAGDAEEDVEATTRIFDERYGKNSGSAKGVERSFSKLSVRDRQDANRFSDGSYYDEDGRSSNGGRMKSGNSNGNSREPPSPTRFREYDRQEPAYPRSHSPYTSTSRTDSPQPQRAGSSASTGRNYSAEAALSRSMSGYRPELEQSISYTSNRRPEDDSPRSFSSNPSTQPYSASSSAVNRARSGSNANSPPISASNPNTAFVKIKVFDRLTQDLIAIRVNPRVTHDQLMDKVRNRLGEDVQRLAYRNSISNTFANLDDDQSLKQWLDATDKHVLYAD